MCGLLLFLCCQYKCWLLHLTKKWQGEFSLRRSLLPRAGSVPEPMSGP